MSSGPLIVLVSIWESRQRDGQGVVFLYKQYRCVWYQKVWCLPMTNTQSRLFLLARHSNEGNNVPDSAFQVGVLRTGHHFRNVYHRLSVVHHQMTADSNFVRCINLFLV